MEHAGWSWVSFWWSYCNRWVFMFIQFIYETISALMSYVFASPPAESLINCSIMAMGSKFGIRSISYGQLSSKQSTFAVGTDCLLQVRKELEMWEPSVHFYRTSNLVWSNQKWAKTRGTNQYRSLWNTHAIYVILPMTSIETFQESHKSGLMNPCNVMWQKKSQYTCTPVLA